MRRGNSNAYLGCQYNHSALGALNYFAFGFTGRTATHHPFGCDINEFTCTVVLAVIAQDEKLLGQVCSQCMHAGDDLLDVEW